MVAFRDFCIDGDASGGCEACSCCQSKGATPGTSYATRKKMIYNKGNSLFVLELPRAFALRFVSLFLPQSSLVVAIACTIQLLAYDLRFCLEWTSKDLVVSEAKQS